MKLELKDYVIDSDEYAYTLYKRVVVKESTDGRGIKPKEENIGKERLVAVGFYRTLDQVITAIGEKTVMTSPDIVTAIEKLNDLEKEIINIADKMSLRIKLSL